MIAKGHLTQDHFTVTRKVTSARSESHFHYLPDIDSFDLLAKKTSEVRFINTSAGRENAKVLEAFQKNNAVLLSRSSINQ